LGNTYNAITVRERINFSNNISKITEPGDVLLVEIDAKLTKKAYEKAQGGVFTEELKPFFTSFFSLLDGYECVQENEGSIFVKRFLTSNNQEVIYTKYSDIKNKQKFLPLVCVPVGCKGNRKSIESIQEIKKVFKEHTILLFKKNIWYLDGVVRLYKSESDITLIMGVLRRIPK